MGKAKPFLFGGLLSASVMFVAMQYHVIRSHDGFQLVPRTPQHSIGLAYADIRNWDATQWTDRPELARALMAHGSADLISQSVAKNLADTVTSESATLDQLRSFLNQPATASEIPDAGLFQALDSETAEAADLDTRKSGTEEPIAIPFPRETRQPPQSADTLRLTQEAGSDAKTGSPLAKSRFNADDILQAENLNRAVQKPTLTQGPVAPTQPRNENAAASTTSPRTSSPFEEVTTDLESRARMALNRAQSTLNEPDAGRTATGAGALKSNNQSEYTRNQFRDDEKPETPAPSSTVPRNSTEADRSAVRAPAAGNDPTENFDPFIE